MDCYLCKAPASEEPLLGDWHHVKCPECGEYQLVDTAVAMAASRTVDVEAMRSWLASQRESSKKVPRITSPRMRYK